MFVSFVKARIKGRMALQQVHLINLGLILLDDMPPDFILTCQGKMHIIQINIYSN